MHVYTLWIISITCTNKRKTSANDKGSRGGAVTKHIAGETGCFTYMCAKINRTNFFLTLVTHSTSFHISQTTASTIWKQATDCKYTTSGIEPSQRRQFRTLPDQTIIASNCTAYQTANVNSRMCMPPPLVPLPPRRKTQPTASYRLPTSEPKSLNLKK